MDSLQGRWKSELTKDDRIKVCQHILDKLVEACPPNFDHEALKTRTRRFEMGVFQTAASRQDYLERIAESLSQIEQMTWKLKWTKEDRDNIFHHTEDNLVEACQPTFNHENLGVQNRRCGMGTSQAATSRQDRADCLGDWHAIAEVLSQIQERDWKRQMTKDDRIKVCQHILDKLVDACPPNIDHEILKTRTRRFEMGVFQTAASRQDYLERIAEGLTRIQEQSQRA